MDGENRRSREAVRNSIRTYGVKVMDPASLPLKKIKERESQESVSRFSEKSLHSQYRNQEDMGKSVLQRIPYATIMACIITLVGVTAVAVTRKRAAVLIKNVLIDLFKREDSILGEYETVFLVLEIVALIVSVMVLIMGILATGDTRARVYGAWRARVGGRCCCAILMIITFILFGLWMVNFWFFTALFIVTYLGQYQCDEFMEGKKCLNLNLMNHVGVGRGIWNNANPDTNTDFPALVFHFCGQFVMFLCGISNNSKLHVFFTILQHIVPIIYHLLVIVIVIGVFFTEKRSEDFQHCLLRSYKLFCKDFIEKVKPPLFGTSVGCAIVVFGLVLYLVCLAANYARIRSEAKLQELAELRNLEIDLTSSKDRF